MSCIFLSLTFKEPCRIHHVVVVEPRLRWHLLSGAGLETHWEAREGFAMGAENPSPPQESGDTLRVKGEMAGSVWTRVLLISVTLAFVSLPFTQRFNLSPHEQCQNVVAIQKLLCGLWKTWCQLKTITFSPRNWSYHHFFLTDLAKLPLHLSCCPIWRAGSVLPGERCIGHLPTTSCLPYTYHTAQPTCGVMFYLLGTH